jgi:membrane fusion protein (multidrug efflux system)
MDPIKATFSIAETWYLDLARADRAARAADAPQGEFAHVPLIRLPDGSLYEHEGRFDFVDNKVDEATGTVQVRAEFPNPGRLLLPGQFVNVIIEREEAVDAVLIPQAAILTDQGGSYVLLVNDEDVVESRRIETGQRFGPNLVVKEGLKAGERIVLYGIQKVRPGIAVVPEMSAAPSDPMGEATGGSVRDEVIVADGDSPDEAVGSADSEAAAVPAESVGTDAAAAPAGDTGAADAAAGDDDADAADAAGRSE